MKFTVSTKPLINGVNLAIVDTNITRYYPKSSVVYITASDNSLIVHHDGEWVSTSIAFKGSFDGSNASIYVDASLFKKLVSTLTASNQVTFEFTSDCLILHSGTSKYKLQQAASTADFIPNVIESLSADELDHGTSIDASDWKFIKSNQIYIKPTNADNVLHTLVYVSDTGDALVCDLSNSLFSHSSISGIGETCMLQDTIVNVLASADHATLVKRDDKFIVASITDAYECLSSFTPVYESDDTGNYRADLFINLIQENNDSAFLAKVPDLKKAMNQATLLSGSRPYAITCDFLNDHIDFRTDTMECQIPIVNGPSNSYTLNFNPDLLGKVVNHIPETDVNIRPTYNRDEIVGLIFECGYLTVVLGACE